jgi:hypothetical protein
MEYRKKSVKVEVPPGAILVFRENIVHEIVGKKAKYNMMRLFLCWRLTQSSQPLFPHDVTMERLKKNAVMPLKSGQMPPMYAALHWVNYPHMLNEWSQAAIRPHFTESRSIRTGRRAGQVYSIPKSENPVSKRVMRSLHDLDLPLYTYSERELAQYIPSRSWSLRAPLTGHLIQINL